MLTIHSRKCTQIC